MGNADVKNDNVPSTYTPSFFPPIHIGMIIDVSKENQNELIRLDKEKNFLENFFSEYKGDIVTLINGNEQIPYIELNELILSIIKNLKDENKISPNEYGIFDSISGKKKNAFENLTLLQIFENITKNNNLHKLTDAKIVYENLMQLKKILSDSYNSFLPAFFENYNNSISKPSSIIPSLNYIMKILSKNSKNNYIIIISDGVSKQDFGDVKDLLFQAQKMNISIATLLLSKDKNIKNKFYNEFPNHLNPSMQGLFNISSKVSHKNPFARYFIKEDYDFPKSGEAKLLLETNFEELTGTNSLANNINNINLEGINIKIGDLNYDSFISFNFKFIAKNQTFGTCWANACAGAMSLTDKRILGKKFDSFQTNRENIIRIASKKNEDGCFVDDRKIKSFFERKRIHIKQVNEDEAKIALQKGRFILCSFWLIKRQWDNFCDHCRGPNRTQVLKDNIINSGCREAISTRKREQISDRGHAVLLIEANDNYLKFLNSWGADWAEGGTFKIQNSEVLTSFYYRRRIKFYDVVYYENELTEGEKNYYYNNIDYIRELISRFDNISAQSIISYINGLNENREICENCRREIELNKFKVNIENGLHNITCPYCNFRKQADGRSKEWLILNDLMYDGNDDFDINFQENQYIQINRLELHKDFNNNIINKSDTCAIGSENECEKKIDSHFIDKVNSIIYLGDGKFMACDKNLILVFKIREIRTRNTIKGEIDTLAFKNIFNENILSLCDLKIRDSNLIATGGKELKIFDINYKTKDLILKLKFTNNKKINKILLIDVNHQEIIKRIVVCDEEGYIGFYNIKIINSKLEFSFSFKKSCHYYEIDSILYIPEEQILVSGSSGDRNIKFWEIQNNNLILKDCLRNIPSTRYHNSLLNINGNLLIGEENGIRVIRYQNKRITSSYFFKDEDFGGVFAMKHLGNNYFICGRSFGFCSLFLLRENSLRKINIFRNNNLSVYQDENTTRNDEYSITDICIRKKSETEGNILISSVDKTLKVYNYEYHNISTG